MDTQKTKQKTAKKYFEAVGRRKEAVARVRITPDSKTEFVVNDKQLTEYFAIVTLHMIAEAALNLTQMKKDMGVSVKVVGSGVHAQAEAIRLGIARALIKLSPELRTPLKQAGFLKRDPRQVERKKFGLRKARRAPQWSKR